MGAELYWYFVPYNSNVNWALQELRRREFRAGRYNPVMPLLYREFPIGPDSPAPGAAHASIEEALEDAAEDGTRSILDIQTIADEPDFCVAAPLPDAQLESHFGTPRPTHEMIESHMDFLESIERGHGIYIVAYKDGTPDEIFFAGYSFD